MRRRRWSVLVVSGVALVLGCTPVPPDPCRGVDPPLATFRVAPEGGELPVLVTVDASDSLASAGRIVGYRWEFGDGTTAEGRVVQHRFERAPGGEEEQGFRVTLIVIQESVTAEGTCSLVAQAVRVLRYGISRTLNVVRWELKGVYYGSLIEGIVRNESADERVTHAVVQARFYRKPGHLLVGQAQRELWDIRPGEERLFMIATYLWPEEFSWVELRTEAFTAQP